MANVYYFPMAFRGLAMNQHRSATGTEVLPRPDTIRVDRFDLSRIQQRDQREALHLLSGGDLGDATLTFRYLSVSGMIKASTGSKLSDLIGGFLQAFQVEEAQLASSSTGGVSAFTFTDTTEVVTTHGTAWLDPVTGITDGEYVAEQLMGRPASFPIVTGRRSGGDSALFAVELVIPNPRRLLTVAESKVANAGNGFAIACPNWNAAQGIAVPPVLTIVMAGAGSAALTIDISGDGVSALVLAMSAETAGTFTVDMETGLIKKASTHRADLRTSAAATLYGRIPRGGGTMTITNTTNVTSVTAAYSQARM